MNITEKDAKICGYGNYPVTITDNVMIPMRDGIHLSSKFWFPQTNVSDLGFNDAKHYIFYGPTEPAADKNYPAILEYIPYRKNDYTAERDHLRHPWMASHGYVVVRVDMRGSGDSEGLYFDEYLLQEQEDCIDVLAWIGGQSWSNKAVGMYGKSWGGFNGLQVAYHEPPELKAVISVYSTDDRYSTDTPHDGGCQTGDAMISWASYMFGWNARAPDPRVTPNWKHVWTERLNNASAPWGPKWLNHELRDEYWQHGSICEDYSRVKTPILAIGGWKDAYTDAVFRMVEKLVHVRGIVGPWPHEWPDKCLPGPNIEYLQVCLHWWNYHLKGKHNGAMEEPKFRIYLQDSCAPSTVIKCRPGKWLYTERWPDPNSTDTKIYALNDTSLDACGSAHGVKIRSTTEEGWNAVPFSLQCGQTHGEWLDFGFPQSSPDQRLSDAHSFQVATQTLTQDLSILGLPTVNAVVRVQNHDKGMLAARLVDVAATGESNLITYGYLNLTHRDGHEPGKVKLLEPGQEYRVTLQLHSAGYVIPKGHRLRLSLSACYWPGTWPPSKQVQVEILNGSRDGEPISMLQLPITTSEVQSYSNPLFQTTDPKISTTLPVEYKSEPKEEMQNVYEQVTNKLIKTVEHDSGLKFYKTLGLVMQHKYNERYEITGNDPLSAKAITEHENLCEYPDCKDDSGKPIKIRIHTTSEMTGDESKFYYDSELVCYLNEETFYSKQWKENIDRKFV